MENRNRYTIRKTKAYTIRKTLCIRNASYSLDSVGEICEAYCTINIKWKHIKTRVGKKERREREKTTQKPTKIMNIIKRIQVDRYHCTICDAHEERCAARGNRIRFEWNSVWTVSSTQYYVVYWRKQQSSSSNSNNNNNNWKNAYHSNPCVASTRFF